MASATVRGLDDDVERNVSQRGRDGNHNNEVGAAFIEGIHRNHKNGTSPGLLVPSHGIQVSQPDFTPRCIRRQGHKCGFLIGKSVSDCDIEFRQFSAIIRGGGRIRGKGLISRRGAGEEAMAAINLQSVIKHRNHAGIGIASKLSEKSVPCVRNQDGGRHFFKYTPLNANLSMSGGRTAKTMSACLEATP